MAGGGATRQPARGDGIDEGVDRSNVYSFGPAVATVTDADADENDAAEFAGQTDVGGGVAVRGGPDRSAPRRTDQPVDGRLRS